MTKFRVTEIELPSCEHLRYIWFTLPSCVDKGGYVAVTSYNSYFCGYKRRRNHGPGRMYVAREEWEIDYYFPDVPIVEVDTIWDFYKLIGFDYKRNKYGPLTTSNAITARQNPPVGYRYDANMDMFKKMRQPEILDELTAESQKMGLY